MCKDCRKIIDECIRDYEISLLRLYGLFISGKDLRHLLGYQTGDAFRQAVRRGNIPFPTFIPEGRRNRVARSRDIAIWLASLDKELIHDGNKGGKP